VQAIATTAISLSGAFVSSDEYFAADEKAQFCFSVSG